MNKNEHQVQLDELIFTQSWEDPECDLGAFGTIAGKKLMAITSGGCNVLCFLRHDPEIIFAVDINPVQSWVLELKMAAMKHLDHAGFTGFLGLIEMKNRDAIFASLQKDMSEGAVRFWKNKKEEITAGFLGKGKFEAYTRKSGKRMQFLQGRKRVNELFAEKSAEAQRRFFDQRWDTWQLRTAFKLMYSKRRLAKRGLMADYFQFDDGSKSFAENFYNRHRNVIREIPIRGNYFVAQYLLGQYRTQTEVPDYLHPDHFSLIQSRLGRVKVITEDAKTWMLSQPESSLDAFALSNICELMSDEDTRRTWEAVYHAARNGARICFRNLMVPRTVPADMQEKIVKDEALSRQLISGDRSFVYSRVDGLEVRK